MDIMVVGPGAMGCLFASRLKSAGSNVVLLDYKQERAELINSQGIIVEEPHGSSLVKVPAILGGPAFTPEVIIIFVKATQTRAAAQSAARFAGPGTLVLTLQNGLGNLDILVEIFGSERVSAGITAEGGTLLGPGRVRHAGSGETIIGRPRPLNDVAERLIETFNRAGFKAMGVESIEGLIWGKLIVNVGINALAAITGLRNGDLPRIEPLRMIMKEAVEEAAALAEAKGIALPYGDPLKKVFEVCESTSANLASMLQDVLRKRQTEVDAINGAVALQAEVLGIQAPVNRTLARLIKGVEQSYSLRT
jgi:2-dehydropantoate 2-reductase